MKTTTSHTTVLTMLKKADIKPSVQRIAVTGYVVSHRTHPTADEIFRALHPEYPTMSRTTVYNTLRRLVEAGAIRMLGIDPANMRYDGNTDDHAHFICSHCGGITDVEMPRMPEMPEGLDVAATEVTYRGCCDKCRESSRQADPCGR